jgi:multicomponent Na+:H+ antiporter subunit G
VIELLAAILIIAGSVFGLIAAIGMIRLPDTLIRMHAATKAGTLGAGLILAGAAFFFAELGLVLRALLTLMFLYLTAPVAAHLIGRAAYRSGIDLFARTCIDHLAEDMQTGSEIEDKTR